MQDLAQDQVEKNSAIVKDAYSSGPTRAMVVLVFAAQVIVGQFLPILGSREPNFPASAMVSMIGWAPALVASFFVGFGLLASILHRRSQALTFGMYACWKFMLAAVSFHFDPYASVLFVVYGAGGIYMAALARMSLKVPN